MGTEAGSPCEASDAASLAAVRDDEALGTTLAAAGLAGGCGGGGGGDGGLDDDGGGGGLDDDGFVGDNGRLAAGVVGGDFGTDGGSADAFVGGEVGVAVGDGPQELWDFCLQQLKFEE